MRRRPVRFRSLALIPGEADANTNKARPKPVLAIAASVLLSGSASRRRLRGDRPAQAPPFPRRPAAPAKPGVLFGVVTVTNPGPTTEPLKPRSTLPLTASDTDTAGYPLAWSAPELPALGLTIAATSADGTAAAITGTVPGRDAGTYEIAVTGDGLGSRPPQSGPATLELTLANTVTVTSPGTQAIGYRHRHCAAADRRRRHRHRRDPHLHGHEPADRAGDQPGDRRHQRHADRRGELRTTPWSP